MEVSLPTAVEGWHNKCICMQDQQTVPGMVCAAGAPLIRLMLDSDTAHDLPPQWPLPSSLRGSAWQQFHLFGSSCACWTMPVKSAGLFKCA